MVLNLSILVFALLRSVVYRILCTRSSRSLHNSAFESLINTNLRFFHLNPSGRIINRFAKDVAIVDEFLPKALIEAIQILSSAAGAVVVTWTVSLYFSIPSGIVIVGFYWIGLTLHRTTRNINRLEGISKMIFVSINQP